MKLPKVLSPPVVRTTEGAEEKRSASWLELFFDLCFVVAVAALARGLHDDPTLEGALHFSGLFVPVWWSWMIFTWYATSFDNDDVPYRVTMLAAMLCMLGLAASVRCRGRCRLDGRLRAGLRCYEATASRALGPGALPHASHTARVR